MAPAGDPGLTRFAAGVVGLEADEAGSVPLAALLAKLHDADFLPDPLAHQALLALAGQPVGPGSLLAEGFAEAEGRRLGGEVERFAAGFFDRPVAERVEAYRLLGMACAGHPRLLERLALLRRGLMIDRANHADPSPTVARLVDDVFALFPLRPGPRAVEGRERAARFRSDSGSSEADRAGALKTLARGHPEVVALVPEHTARLRKVRKRASTEKLRAGVAAFVASSAQRPYWILGAILLTSMGRLASQAPAPSAAPSSRAVSLPATRSDDPTAQRIHQFIRDEIKGSTRRELERIGRQLDNPGLDRVVAALPVEELPAVGGLASVARSGGWTAPVRARLVASLKAALKAADLGLDDRMLDDLAPRCFPQATPGGPK